MFARLLSTNIASQGVPRTAQESWSCGQTCKCIKYFDIPIDIRHGLGNEITIPSLSKPQNPTITNHCKLTYRLYSLHFAKQKGNGINTDVGRGLARDNAGGDWPDNGDMMSQSRTWSLMEYSNNLDRGRSAQSQRANQSRTDWNQHHRHITPFAVPENNPIRKATKRLRAPLQGPRGFPEAPQITQRLPRTPQRRRRFRTHQTQIKLITSARGPR